jgi:DNA-binding phage protein
VTDHAAAATSGVAHGALLVAFAEAMAEEDDDALTHVRHAVIEVLSPAVMVDAAGVASNFERMVRIADATGIQLDERMQTLSQEVRDTLHLERFTVHKERT